MAFEIPGHSLGILAAGQDLSAAQFLFVKVNTVGEIVKCSVSGEGADGVLQNKPVSGQSATVDRDGISKVVAGGGGIAVADLVTPNASGQAILAATGDFVAGRCLVAAGSGQIGTITLKAQGKK
jgi:hypothetical protein